jgi:hypothetical protein
MLLFEKSIAFSDQAVANTFFGRPVIKFTEQFKEVSKLQHPPRYN